MNTDPLDNAISRWCSFSQNEKITHFIAFNCDVLGLFASSTAVVESIKFINNGICGFRCHNISMKRFLNKLRG